MMLVIRDRQLRALARAALVRWLVEHLNDYFPEHCRALGEAGLLEEIRFGIARASSHGFSAEKSVAQYLDLMFAVGRDFDERPEFPWARAILSDRTLSAGERIERLRQAAIAHLRAQA